MNVNAKIRETRRVKKLTLEKLAQITGFTKGYLSKIERSDVPPPFATVQRIAEALQMELVDMIDTDQDVQESKNIDLMKHVRREEEDAVYSFNPLIHSYRNKQMAPFLFKVQKGTTQRATHDSEEFVYVVEGCVELNYEGKVYGLEKGDAFYLDSRISHYFTNRREEPAVMVAVHFNYKRF